MTDKVNGNAKAGEFIVSNISYYTVATLVPVAQTNVDTPVADLYVPSTGWANVSVTDGTGTVQVYSTQAAYQDAFNKQANLNTLVQTFQLRASLLAMSVTVTTDSAPNTSANYAGYSYAQHFGSAYSASGTVTLVKFATDRLLPWLVQAQSATDDTNTGGYQLLDALQGVAVSDITATVLATDVFETLSATNTNTLAFVTNTL